MNRRDIFRVIGAAGAAAALPAPARDFPKNYDPEKELARPGWKPIFFDAHQNDTMIALSDLVIPATDTPGAKEALANRFIDSIMAVEPTEVQREFLGALAFLDGESMERYRAAFLHASREQQTELLSYMAHPQTLEMWGGSVKGRLAAHTHFLVLKDWIARAYYSSEIGNRELGSDGTAPHGQFTGCEKE